MKDIQKIKEFFSKPLNEVQEKYYVEPSKKGFSVLRNGNEITSFDTEEEAKQHADKLNKMKFLSKGKFNEAKSEDSYEVVWTDRDYKKHSKVFKNDPKGAPDNAKKKAEAFKKSLEDKDKKSKEGLYRSIDLNEAKSEDKVDTITMDIPLFLRMLEYSREDAAEDMDLHDVTEKAISLGKERGILQMEDYDEIVGAVEKINEAKGSLKVEKQKDGKYYWTFTFESGKVEKWPNGFDTSADAQKDFIYRSKYLKETTINEDEGIKVGDIVSKKYASTDEDYTKEFKVISITGMSATLQDTKTGKKVGIALNDLTKSPMKEATTDYSKRRQAQDDYAINKKDKPAKSYNPTPSGKTDYMKRRQKEIAEAIIAKLKK